MHLETILKDLRERFARCELAVSPPLVAFRESVAAEAEAADAAAPRPARVCKTPSACCQHNGIVTHFVAAQYATAAMLGCFASVVVPALTMLNDRVSLSEWPWPGDGAHAKPLLRTNVFNVFATGDGVL